MDQEWFENTTETLVVAHSRTREEERVAAPDKAQLIVLVGAEASRTHVVDGEVTIGRSQRATVRLPGDDISRVHARIRRTGPGVFTLEDNGSKNGTLVNGVPVKRQVLEFGDKIRIGTRTILMFSRYDQIEDQLMQSQRLASIGQLAGGVAHDFNNLLGAILANVGFLRGLGHDVPLGAQSVQEALGDIEAALARSVSLIRQVLGLTRREQREEREVDLGRVIEEVASLVRRTFPRSIELAVQADEPLYVMGDSSQLHQMLMNLCINARDAMPDGGQLALRCRAVSLDAEELERLPHLGPGLHVELTVSDTGAGMDEQTRRRVFEPFFTTKGKGQGTGLGLATVFGIVKQHGGHITVHSRPGQGTTFRVHMPAVEADRTPSAEFRAGGAHDTVRLFSGLVLLVDDEELFLGSTRRLLEGMGYAVLCASSGEQAVQAFREHRDMIELVLLDMVMPGMGGAETFHALRGIDPEARVLVSSGQTGLEGVRELLAAGARGLLQKPYDAGALGEAISRVLFEPA